jgi:hypothetical protein
MQLAFSVFDELPFAFTPRPIVRTRRATRSPSGHLVIALESQLSLLDLLTMREEDIGPVVWSDDDVSVVREGILREACHTLLDTRTGLDTRVNRWKWIMNDDWMPFSFRACAAACEVDYEELRESLISLCRHHKVLHTLQAA